MKSIHVSVMLKEVLEYLEGENKSCIVDCTFGGGGHTDGILKHYPHIKVIGIDRDQEALERGELMKEKYKERLSLFHSNYKELPSVLENAGITKVDAFLLDLGVSSDLIENAERGFSFQKDGPLDMRMDKNSSLTAEVVVNSYPKEVLEKIFFEYGEEHNAKKIAKAICEYRKKQRITTTFELVRLVNGVIRQRGKIHPATKVFQALRIEVNDELNSLKSFLETALNFLTEGGRILVISFHSLEDRLVKTFFKEAALRGELKIVTKKPLTPTLDEVKRNPKSRSAKLRVAQKICQEFVS